MSLNYDFTKCLSLKMDTTEASEANNHRHLMPWTSLHIGLGEVTEKNEDEWRFRIAFLNATGFHLGSVTDRSVSPVRGKGINVPLRLVWMFRGFKTNVGDITRAAFLKKEVQRLTRDAQDEIRYEIRSTQSDSAALDGHFDKIDVPQS